MSLRSCIPNFITSMNLLCGSIGVIFALDGSFEAAFLFMIAGAVCDFLDGFAARLLGAYSDIGRELDSLADVVTFGLLPSMMLCRLSSMLGGEDAWYACIPLVMVAFSALRLAKFNVDDSQGTFFAGLPTPANALLCASLCCFTVSGGAEFLLRWASGPVFLPLLSLVLSLLLVSRIRMFSFKFHKGDARSLTVMRVSVIALALLSAAACALFAQHWSLAVLSTMLFYVVSNIILSIARV